MAQTLIDLILPVGARVKDIAELQDQRSDLELIAAVNGGDPEAFAALYWRYRDWVLNLARRFTGDDDAALDVMQETFLYFLKKFPGFQLRCQLKTFLYPAVRNLSIAARQKAKRYQGQTDANEEVEAQAAPVATKTHEADLEYVLGTLPDEQREVLLLRFADELTLAEIAEALSVPLGTVKSRLHNALQTLRENKRTRILFEQ